MTKDKTSEHSDGSVTYRKDLYYINKDCGWGIRSEAIVPWHLWWAVRIINALGISKLKYRKMKGCNVLRHDKDLEIINKRRGEA